MYRESETLDGSLWYLDEEGIPVAVIKTIEGVLKYSCDIRIEGNYINVVFGMQSSLDLLSNQKLLLSVQDCVKLGRYSEVKANVPITKFEGSNFVGAYDFHLYKI